MNTVVLAIGNAGGNIVESIRREAKDTQLELAGFVFADTSAEDLQRHSREGNMTICLRHEDDSFPQDVFFGVERLIIVAGLGGRTGTKFSIMAVEAAKACGVNAITVIITMPFLFEGRKHIECAESAANRISHVEGVSFFALNNQDLLERYPDLNFVTAFNMADMEIVNIVLNAI